MLLYWLEPLAHRRRSRYLSTARKPCKSWLFFNFPSSSLGSVHLTIRSGQIKVLLASCMSLRLSLGDLHTCCFPHSSPLVGNSYPSESSLIPTSLAFPTRAHSPFPGLASFTHIAVLFTLLSSPWDPHSQGQSSRLSCSSLYLQDLNLTLPDTRESKFSLCILWMNKCMHKSIFLQEIYFSGSNGVYEQSFPANYIQS